MGEFSVNACPKDLGVNHYILKYKLVMLYIKLDATNFTTITNNTLGLARS